MDDRGILQWDKRLTDQARRGWDNYKHLHIDLSTARIDQSYLIAGEYLYVEQSSSADAIAKIKLNRVNNDALDLEKNVEIETVFIEIFVSNDALQDEWIDLVFGINFKYKKKIKGSGLIGDTYVDVYRSTNQGIPSGIMTLVNFDTEITDRNNEFDLATDLFTAKNAGEYLFLVHAKLDAIDDARRMGLYPFHNVNFIQEINVMSSVNTASIGALGGLVVTLLKNDTLCLKVWHNCAVMKNLLAGLSCNRLQVYRLR